MKLVKLEKMFRKDSTGKINLWYELKNPIYIDIETGEILNHHHKKKKPFISPQGYVKIKLQSNEGYRTLHETSLHTLVLYAATGDAADGFIIHHINNERMDNRLENLEYIDVKHHVKTGYEEGVMKSQGGRKKEVSVHTAEGEFVGVFPSITAASAATGVPIRSISKRINGVLKNPTGGYIFKLLSET